MVFSQKWQELRLESEQMAYTQEDIEAIFTYHAPPPDQIPKYEAIRWAAKNFAKTLLEQTPTCYEQRNLIRKLQHLAMYANYLIALDGKIQQ